MYLQIFGQVEEQVNYILDYFKQVNDTFGHGVGDEVLKTAAILVTGTIRSTDILARYGGEEFIITLPETNEGGAAELAGKIRNNIARHLFPAVGHIPVSIGLGQCPSSETDSELITKADNALYVAKKSGRNRVKTALPA